MTTSKLFTADELLQMPDDGWRYELVEGRLVKMAPAGYGHGIYAMRIGSRMAVYVDQHGLGRVLAAETGFRLAANPDTVLAPDVAFVSRERDEEIGEVSAYWPGAPNLAVEVISPNDTYTEVESKVFQWLDAGTKAVVVVNPRRESVTAYRSRSDITVLAGDDVLGVEDVIPGWTMPLRGLFE